MPPPSRTPPQTFSGTCHGTLGELFQGPLTYQGSPHIALVSLPVDRHTWHHFTPYTGEPPPHAAASRGQPRPHGEKSARAADLFLKRYGLTLPPGEWSHHSELDVGVGMASSTADVVAVLRCLRQVLGLPYDQRVLVETLAEIERADSVFLDEFALYLSDLHHVVRGLGTSLRFHTAYVTGPEPVDTEAVTGTLLRHYARRPAAYIDCLNTLLKGFSARDPHTVARAATTSAVLAQEALPKAEFEAVYAARESFAADGVFVAHTGSVLGYLYARRPSPALKSELSAFFRTLGHQCSFAHGGCW
ncbi:hypothetical protein [Streptomyces iconiensis]|uniref:GHMP kinase N-terminal domain-containing protein n=1 Tax=Streptomyces iconiensis TaxID=1384038 RepID=A0ABT7A6W0_9ACTN|nr:hypothetical protein [Streptomyces iconiensis]MDJ1137056.1 hypothetical protein [Streptomyces iconiensis]